MGSARLSHEREVRLWAASAMTLRRHACSETWSARQKKGTMRARGVLESGGGETSAALAATGPGAVWAVPVVKVVVWCGVVWVMVW
jgi:hypothetical protein